MAEQKDDDRDYRARKWYGWFAAATLLVLALIYFYYLYPKMGLGAKQPIYFSHRVHAGVKQIDCRFCHPFVERSEHAGLPTVEKCFYCHKYVIPMHPQLVKEKQYLENQKPVPWVKIFYVPDFVKFRHLPHINWGKLECAECHGEIQTMDRLKPIDFQMGFCINCHEKKKAELDCWLACHH